MWIRELRASALMLLAFTLLTGVAYPLLVTGVAQVVAPDAAHGSLVRDERGVVVGSRLIGQAVTRPEYFWPRPSAAGQGYDALSSSGSNLAVGHPDLIAAVKQRVAALREADPPGTRERGQPGAIPVDLVTASGSGLDPDISPAAALYQVPRVARLRNVPAEKVEALVMDHITPRALGLFGEPRVNVLELDLALDRLAPRPAAPR